MKVVAWNINDYVTVQLTDFGVEVYRNYLYPDSQYHWGSANEVARKDWELDKLEKNGGRLRKQGWALIEIFAPYMTPTSPSIFVDATFYVEVNHD